MVDVAAGGRQRAEVGRGARGQPGLRGVGGAPAWPRLGVLRPTSSTGMTSANREGSIPRTYLSPPSGSWLQPTRRVQGGRPTSRAGNFFLSVPEQKAANMSFDCKQLEQTLQVSLPLELSLDASSDFFPCLCQIRSQRALLPFLPSTHQHPPMHDDSSFAPPPNPLAKANFT